MDSTFFLALLAIIWIDLILSADNAILIALACRGLPEEQRKMGILLGTAAAIGLRILFAIIIAKLLSLPFIRIIGGLLLLWIAIKLITDTGGEHEVASSDKLWKAVGTIAIADGVMSLDNVVAIAAVAKGDLTLMILGVLISIPMIIYGAKIFMTLIDKYPIIIWAGAALLGYLAGDMLVSDIVVTDAMISKNPSLVILNSDPRIGNNPLPWIERTAGVICALFVVGLAFMIRKKQKTI
jgi:YjbE family integral membrane protein